MKRIDLTGQQINDWKVIEYAGNSQYLCECSCGKRKLVKTQYLKNGKSKSCGHNTTSFKDLKNMQFGDWTVLEYVGDQLWKCRCSCGTEKEVLGYYLLHGKSKSCGHNTNKINNESERNREFKDLTGQKFNEWSVIKYLGKSMWRCRCSCGVERDVHRYSLITGRSKSCGHNLLDDLTNQRFGRLTAIKYMGNQQWLCQCDCGNKTIVYAHNLKRKDTGTKSCGCINTEVKLTKHEIETKLIEFINEHNEKPFVSEVQELINRSETVTREYLKEYNLEYYINRSFRSKFEKEIVELFNTSKVITNNRDMISNQELDIYLPDKKVAIEFNGSYWHSEAKKDKYYHQNKTIKCIKNGIRLIHIFEYEWVDINTRNKIEQLLKSIDNDTRNVIYARNTEIKEIDYNKSAQFCEMYHLQNSAKSTINLGCYHNDKLIGVMTFGTPRFNSTYEYELIRLCWKDNIKVVGGAEKLLSYFKQKYNPTSIISYCNVSKFDGQVYFKLGFKPTKEIITEPNYVWVEPYKNIVIPRYQTQKHKLIEQGLGDETQSESEIMHNMGFYRVYDCGNIIFEWRR